MKKSFSIFKKLGFLTALLASLQLNGLAQTYCTPSYQYPGQSCTYGYGKIYNVNIAGVNGSELDDAPACSPDYKDRTGSVAALQLATGRVYFGSVGINYLYTHYSIWIDYDDDGMFASSERVASGDYPSMSYLSQYLNAPPYYNLVYSFSISIPPTAPTGTHRMRVRSTYTAGTGTATVDPCAITNATSQNIPNYYGSAADYLVTVIAGPACGPTFNTNPVNLSACTGSTVNYTAGTLVSSSLQWQVNNGSGWTNIINGVTYNGATTGTLSVSNVSSSISGSQYRCIATDGTCTSTSAFASLWVKDISVTTQPVSKTTVQAGSAIFSVSVSSISGVAATYQWQMNTGSGFTNITNGGSFAGANSSTVTISNVPLSLNNATFRCVADNGTCSAVSNAATLTVIASTPPQYYYANGTGANNIPLGLGTQWDNYRSQFLYLPGDFGTVSSAGLIKRIYFRASNSNTSATVFSNFKVDIGTSSITSLTSYASGLTNALSETTHSFPVVLASQWIAIDLQTPIYFDPAKSLIVDVSQTGKVGGAGGFLLVAGGVPVNTAYTGNTQVYGPNTGSGTSRRYSYQFGFDMDPCIFTISNQPGNLTVNADAGQCSATNVSLGSPVATSNCGTVTVSNNAPSVFPKGTTTVTWTVTNGYTTQTFTQTVTVVDNQAPVITCPSNITVTAATGECSATVNYSTPTATDNCTSCTSAPPTSISGYTLMGTFGGHTYFRSNFSGDWNYFDSSAKALGGHLATISSQAENNFLNAPPGAVWIGLTDKNVEGVWEWSNGEPVTFTFWCGNEPNDLNGEDYAMITYMGNGCWNDGDGSSNTWTLAGIIEFDCDQNPMLITRTAGLASGSTFPVGTSTVTYTATDGSNNTSNCSFTVTVLPSPNNNVSISVTPSNNTYTGGVPTTIYLGYGPQSATLNATATGGSGFTYSWSPATNLNCTNCQSPVFTPTSAGNYTYTVTATNSNGCSVTKSVTLCVLDVRVPNGNDKVYLCHNGNTISISSNAVPAHLNNHNGDRLGNCEQQCGSSNKGSVENTSAIANEEIKVYPNPSNGNFTVELPNAVENAEINIMEMTGKLIERKQVTGTKAQFSIAVAKGVYMIVVKNAEQMSYSRIVVQ
jgi:hypothetical protein